MMTRKYIGADVHCRLTELAILERDEVVQRHRIPTTIPQFVRVLGTLSGQRILVMEEGPMAGWLSRNLRRHADRIIVTDPRRNHYIAKDGDKSDPIDAAKLAQLARGGYVREVYHGDDEQRVVFKDMTALYHDRVREIVRQINKVYACGRQWGVVMPRTTRNPERRAEWMAELDCTALAEQLAILWLGYDTAAQQATMALRHVRRLAKAYPIIKLWQEVPGIGLVRAATLHAYLDTPWRFRRPNQLCKYCGIGLQRSSSGTDRLGRPKAGTLHVAWAANRRLKDAVMGAATNAIAGASGFGEQYRRLLKKGVAPGNAKRTVGRKLLTVMWSMWKHNAPFDASLLT